MIPKCSSEGLKSIEASYKTLTATVPFTYGAVDMTNGATITAIEPTSWSPVSKGVMKITGSGFGTDLSQLKVYLTNSSGNIYEMKVLSAIDT
jgi:hypothetical protein